MKAPRKAATAAGGKHKAERPQGKIGGTDINKPVTKAKVPQARPGVTYGKPMQTQKL